MLFESKSPPSVNVSIPGPLGTIIKMKKYLIILVIVICSCGSARKNHSVIKIEGNTSVKLYQDNALNDKAIIQGFVYSRVDSSFLVNAAIIIDMEREIGTMTDVNGFFIIEVQPDKYSIVCQYLGHDRETTPELEIANGQRIIVLFELGTTIE